MYEYTDEVIAYLNRQFIRKFNSILAFDEVNALLRKTDEVFAECEKITRQMFLVLAKYYCREFGGDDDLITDMWLYERVLNNFDPVTGYVYVNEVDRKAARSGEAIVASDDRRAAVKKALGYWARQVAQYADEVTDAAVLEAYRQRGIKNVRWLTMEDERVCAECNALDGKVFDIDNIPTKPHIGCRCYFEAVIT